VLTFSMLIDAVYQRLCGEPADSTLADRLFEAFPVALIDEFQDTDQRQFAIFDRIYRERGTLVMIGDPKQAIYSFRGGDIAAYLRASAQANQRFSLATNHRSSRALVEAMNALVRPHRWRLRSSADPLSACQRRRQNEQATVYGRMVKQSHNR
jgi:exodeoxyribonuclease V beta subunit